MMLSRRTTITALLGAATAGLGNRRARAADPIRIGTILSVSGPAAFLGQDMKDGVQLAVDEINDAGGITGRKIEWIFYDAQSQTQQAIAEARRLLSNDGVEIIVGGGNMSGIALAIAPMAEAAKMPFVSTEGASAIVNPVAERRFVFKSTVDDYLVLQRAADYFDTKGLKKIALLADTSGFGQGATEQFKIVAKERNLDAILESFGPGDTDLVPQLSRIRDAGADVVICWTVTPAGVVSLKQAQQLGLDEKLALVHSYGFVTGKYMELAGSAAARLLLLSQKFVVGDQLPDSDPVKPKIAALTDAFKRRFNRTPNQFVAQTYDAIYLAKMALASGGSDREKVREALEGIRDYRCASGIFSFSPERHSGLAKSNIVLVNWANGRFNLADYA
jgi:branched-chain amino acid transport system substrate-binding protein